MLLPLVVLSALGHQQDGVVATQGAFAGFYAFAAPYRRRARVVVGLGCALAVAMALGTLVAADPWVAVPAGAVLAAVAAGGCLALRVGPPREYFIVFTFLIATALPADASDAPRRAGLVLLGAAGAWLISMAGTLRDARAPEREAVDRALAAVAGFLDAIGRPDRAPAARHAAVLAVQRAQEAVADAGGAETQGGAELRRRADAAEALLEASLALMVEKSPPLDPAWAGAVGALADGAWAAPVLPAPQQRPPVPAAARLDAAVRAAGSARRLDTPAAAEGEDEATGTTTPGRWRVFVADLTDRRSPAPAVALRLGVAVGLAGMLGYLLRAEHPTWIPLSAAAVLQGTNVALARQRALQRAIGTAVGVVVAAGVLELDPGLVGLIVLVGILQALTEAFILVSYGVAVVFITSLALLLLEIAGVGVAVRGLLDARLIDTALGCTIGFACGVLILPRRSRSRLAAVQARSIRTIGTALAAGLHGARDEHRRAVHLAVVDLDAAQRDATGDAVTGTTHSDLDWPVTHAIEQLAHIALALPPRGERPAPDSAAMRQLGTLLDDLAARADGRAGGSAPPRAPDLPDWPRTERALVTLRDAVAEFSAPTPAAPR